MNTYQRPITKEQSFTICCNVKRWACFLVRPLYAVNHQLFSFHITYHRETFTLIMKRKRVYSLDEGDLSTFLELWQILLLTSSCFSSFCFGLKQKSDASDTYRSGSETHVTYILSLVVLKIYLNKCRILIVYPRFVTFKNDVWAMYDALHQYVASQASMYN